MEKIIKNMIDDAINAAVTPKIETSHPEQPHNNSIMTAAETVEFLGGGLSYSTLIRECHRGSIPCFRIGKQFYFRKSSLLEWIEQQEHSCSL